MKFHCEFLNSIGLVLAILGTFAEPVFAQPPKNCKCIWQGSFNQISAKSDFIVSGKVLSQKGNSMDFSVDRILLDREINGKEYKKDIRIWGDDGKECRPPISNFPLASDWLFALKKIAIEPENGFNPNTPNISFGRKNDYYISMCGAYWLKVHDGFVTGNLINGGRWLWQNEKMNPVIIELVAAHANGTLKDQGLIEASKPLTASKKLMMETMQFIDRSVLYDLQEESFELDLKL